MLIQDATPDTSAYMIAGYAIFFVLMIIYLVSLFIRSRNLNADLTVLESMKEQNQETESKLKAVRAKPARPASVKPPPAKRKTAKSRSRLRRKSPENSSHKINRFRYNKSEICLFILLNGVMAASLKYRTIVNGFIALLLTFGSLGLFPITSTKAAQPATPPGPDRVTPITVDYTAYDWWMATWNKNKVVCSLSVDHEGQPTLEEIYQNCDTNVYTTYRDQAPCDLVGDKRHCEGYYLFLVDTHKSQRVITVTLPAPEVWLTLEGCDSVSRSGTNVCENDPILVLKGEEPLPNEHIVGIEGTMDGQPFKCDPTCKLQLAATDANGVLLEFWAWSSYGDSSEVFKAQVRVAPADQNNPDQTSWYVDVLSSQWKGVRIASCSDTWQSFPPVGGTPGLVEHAARRLRAE